jgi:hypothetical protein
MSSIKKDETTLDLLTLSADNVTNLYILKWAALISTDAEVKTCHFTTKVFFRTFPVKNQLLYF